MNTEDLERLASTDVGEDELRAEIMLRSFRRFVPYAFEHAEPGVVFKDNWHIGAIGEHLQAVHEGQIDQLLINIPPGTMKSLLVCVLWPAWVWAREPWTRFLFTTYSENFTKRDARKMRNLVNSTWFKRHFADTRLARARSEQGMIAADTVLEYHTSKGGFRQGAATSSGVTGKHVHGIVEDDPMKAQDSHSKAARDSAWNFHSAALPSRLLPDGKTWRVHVAQRLHVDDPSGRILKQGGWTHLKLPMHYNPKRVVLTPLGNPDPREKEGELIWPSRMTEEFVKRRDKGMGPHNVAAQEEQDPTAIEGGIIKRAWLQRRWTKHTLPERFDVEWISADLAFTDTNDPVAIQHWGYVNATFYLIRRIAQQLDFVKSEQALLSMASRSKNAVTMAKVVENKANGAAMISRMRRKVPGFEAFNPQGDKVVRLNAVSPVFASQAVVIPDESEDPTIEDYVEQVCGFPDVLHDDECDATSQAILHFQANHDSLLQLAFGDSGMGTGEMNDPSEKARPFNFDIGVGGNHER